MTLDGDSGHPVSERVRLAGLAAQAIAATDGITPTRGPAGRWQTTSESGSVDGVLAVEDGRGCIELDLHLAARWPPAMPLQLIAEQLRGRVRRSAAVIGMTQRLGAVSVAFDDVLAEASSS